MVCLDHRLIFYNLVQGLVFMGGVLNHSTAFSCCNMSVYGYMTMLKRVYVYACIIALISSTFWNEFGTSGDMI